MNKLKYFWYHYIYWPIYNYFYYKSPIFIGTLNIFKIYKDWLPAYKDFRRPILKCYKLKVDETPNSSDYFHIEKSTYNKWLYFNVYSCYCKLKYGELRFENVPYICLIWRNKVKWIIGLEAPLYYNYYNDNYLYWEALLSYNYEHDRDIVKTFTNNMWYHTYILKDVDKDGVHLTKTIYNTILPALTNRAAEKVIKNHNEKIE